MGQRLYNILFHTHTVSGIVISVALYVIFFTGSFSFFRDEIVAWEHGEKVSLEDSLPLDVDAMLGDIGQQHTLTGRDVEISHYYNERRVNVSLGTAKDSVVPAKDRAASFFYLDPVDKTTGTYYDSYSLGEFLYRLHFLDQIPYPYGRYLAGLVAFFFLFAIITGILVHWDKIISNFYIFRPGAKWKTIWTDAHTALGVIGLPFQLVYAVTGAFFLIKILLVFPFVLGLYGGDQNALYEELEYNHPVFAYTSQPLDQTISINKLIAETQQKWEGFMLTEVHIFNYGDANMHVDLSGHMAYDQKLNGTGHIIYKVGDHSVVEQRNPTTNGRYMDGVKNILFRLHFGDFGGYGLRIIYFVLGLISCFVILSGVLIWITARTKKHIPEKKRRFYAAVGHWYLAICLSLYPITALSFILVKAFPPAGHDFLYRWFFIPWLLATLLLVFKKDNTFTNKICLWAGSIMGFLVPLANGLFSGNWLWTTLSQGKYQVFLVDVLWLLLSGISLWIVLVKLRQKGDTKPAKV